MRDRARIRFPAPRETAATELEIVLFEHLLAGTSVAALATAFVVDRFRTAVDMGRCSASLAAQETVLLTHCHSDHVAGLVAWLSAHTRRFEGAPTRVVVPEERREALLAALEIWPELGGVRRRVELDEVITGANAGDTVVLAGGGVARGFDVHHSVPSLGWAVSEAPTGRPIFAFAGDGTVLPFQDNPGLLDVQIAVVDCSFVEDGTRVAARLGGHGHLSDWLELAPRLPCDALVLAHLPDDLDGGELLQRLESEPTEGPLIVPWITEPGRGP